MSQSISTYLASLRLSSPPVIVSPGTPPQYVLLWDEVKPGLDGHGTVYLAPFSTIGALGSPNLLTAGTPANLSATPALNLIIGTAVTTVFTLPTMAAIAAANANGQIFIVKDGSGIATLANQTIAAPAGTTIDGNSSVALITNFQSISLVPVVAENVWSRV